MSLLLGALIPVGDLDECFDLAWYSFIVDDLRGFGQQILALVVVQLRNGLFPEFALNFFLFCTD